MAPENMTTEDAVIIIAVVLIVAIVARIVGII